MPKNSMLRLALNVLAASSSSGIVCGICRKRDEPFSGCSVTTSVIYLSVFMNDIRYKVLHSKEITPFQRKVYLELLDVPRGTTVTYGELARRVGCRSAQAVVHKFVMPEMTGDDDTYYTVRRGDCLWIIARNFLRRGVLFSVIAERNAIQNPDLIYPKQLLQIPVSGKH